MAKLVTRVLRSQIALLNPLLTHMDLEKMRKLQDALGALGERALRDVEYQDAPFDNFEAAWARREGEESRGAILYLHGGSYTAGSLAYAKGFGGVLSDETGYETLCVGYRLAPEHPFPAALDDALAAYRAVIETHDPCHVALVGESAGGGLCYALCLKLKALNLPLPACVAALSPWTDLTMTLESVEALKDVDPILSADGLSLSARMYGGDDLSSPFISPLYGDLTHMPPSFIAAGTHEILLDDSVLMAKKLNEALSPCQLILMDGLWHGYALYPIPEAKETLEKLRAFVWERTGHVQET